jgi:hypothetical protein
MNLARLDYTPLTDFRYSWRFDDPILPVLPHDRPRIRPLTQAAARVISDRLSHSLVHCDFPFTSGRFSYVESLSLSPVTHQDELQSQDSTVKKWLFRRGIPFSREVYLSYDSKTAIHTSWKMLVRYWRLFYYPISDDLSVFDSSLSWCLLFFHEHELYFGSNAHHA